MKKGKFAQHVFITLGKLKLQMNLQISLHAQGPIPKEIDQRFFSTGCPKKVHKFKSYIFVLRTDKSLNCVSFVRQNFNLNFETQFFKIGQKLTEL